MKTDIELKKTLLLNSSWDRAVVSDCWWALL